MQLDNPYHLNRATAMNPHINRLHVGEEDPAEAEEVLEVVMAVEEKMAARHMEVLRAGFTRRAFVRIRGNS